MKRLLAGTLLFAVAAGLALSVAADEAETGDRVTIEKRTASGAKVTMTRDLTAGVAEKATGQATERSEEGPHKARLAVVPAVFAKHFAPVIKLKESVEASGGVNLRAVFTTKNESRLEAPSFTLSLVEAFAASRKFDVLERARLTEVLQEIDFGESDYGATAMVVPIGRALNAEYVAVPEIEVIHLVTDSRKIPYVDMVKPRYRAKMIARLRIVDVASTKVVAAFSEEVQVEKVLRQTDPFAETEIHNVILDLYGTEATRLAHRALEAIYPIRILDIVGNKIVINRGEGTIAAGDVLSVYQLGKGYVDPDTGEALGQGESEAARATVTRVMPKIAEAEIVAGSGRLDQPATAYLCRETADSIRSKTRVKRDLIPW